MPEKLMTEREISERTGLPVTSLQKWRSETRRVNRGKKKTASIEYVGPVFEKIKGLVRYRISDVNRWIEKELFIGRQRLKTG